MTGRVWLGMKPTDGCEDPSGHMGSSGCIQRQAFHRPSLISFALQHPQLWPQRPFELVQQDEPNHPPAKIDPRKGRHPRPQPSIRIFNRQLDAVAGLIVFVLLAFAANLRDRSVKDPFGKARVRKRTGCPTRTSPISRSGTFTRSSKWRVSATRQISAPF